MQIILHYPQDPADRKAHARKAAEVMARMAISRLENLPLSDSGKLQLLDFILDNRDPSC